jgi:hypothetical protein
MLPILIRVLDITDHRLLGEFEWPQVPPVGAFLHLKNLSGTTAYQVEETIWTEKPAASHDPGIEHDSIIMRLSVILRVKETRLS